MDPAEERAAYKAAVARAEAAAVAAETPATPAEPEQPVVVPVAASDQPLTPEVETPAPAETVETPVVAVVEETPEQLREQIAQLEARIAEKDTFIGRQSGEVGELRQAVDALSQRLDTAASQAVPTLQAPMVPITQDMIDNDPGRATVLAFQQRDEAALQRAFEAWKDPVIGDPTAAASWLSERRIEQANAMHEAKIAELEQRMQQLQAPAAEQAARKEWEKAFAIVTPDRPDFVQNAERILTEVAPKYPAFAKLLAEGDAEQKANVLSALYDIDRAQQTDPASVQTQLEEAAAAAAAEEAATRSAAAAVTGQPTVGQSPVELTPEQQEQQRYTERWAGKASLERGWTGRS